MTDKAAGAGTGRPARAPSDPTRLPEILLESVTALAAAGEVDHACRLAGQAHAVLRHTDPRAARRLNAFMHKMIRKLDW